jgi:molecular chaperone GrpE
MNQEKENEVDQENDPALDEQPSVIEEEAALEGEILEPELELADSEEGSDEASPEEEEEAQPSLEEQLKMALEKAEDNRNDYLRTVADMQNLRKRTARDVKKARSFAIEGFARDLLPVADNMIRALSALEGSDDPGVQSLKEGVEMVQKELDRAFDKHGLVKIEALNAPFDPNIHQAVVQIDSPESEPGQVVQEMQIGYTLNDRLLRPAMVGVSKG